MEVFLKMARLLIVEDSDQIREAVVTFFRQKGEDIFEIDAAADGNQGLAAIRSSSYDLVILDIMLPGPSGFEICRELRRKSSCPIVFLTALGTEDSILKGYEIGADEYMVKPFSLNILYAKCLVLLNRTSNELIEKTISIDEITIYPSKMTVTVSGSEIELTPKEYFLLKVLAENKGHVLGRQRLLDLVWGMGYDGNDRVVDNHVKKLRAKLGPSGSHIKTVIGGGYKVI